MKLAMSILAVLALVAGAIGIPGLSDTLGKFLEPTFESSKYVHDQPSTSTEWADLGIGGVLGITGIAIAYLLFIRRRSLRLEIRERFNALHTFLVNKWYFDELYDAVFTRPVATFGQFGRRVIETEFVQGVIVGGTTSVVRAGSTFARSLQVGYLRFYAAFLLVGISALGLYFLISAT
jgi:NADH-quinone oxidoreductase subunit L